MAWDFGAAVEGMASQLAAQWDEGLRRGKRAVVEAVVALQRGGGGRA